MGSVTGMAGYLACGEAMAITHPADGEELSPVQVLEIEPPVAGAIIQGSGRFPLSRSSRSVFAPSAAPLQNAAVFGLLVVERKKGDITPALETTRLLPVVAEEILGRDPQKGSQLPLLRRKTVEDLSVEDILGEVLGVGRRQPLPAREGVDRQPVGPANLLESPMTHRTVTPLRLQHDTPPRVRKLVVGFGAVVGSHE